MVSQVGYQPTFDLVAPKADVLMESLRATGYSLPDAVSDLIDNSITASARNIWLKFHWSGSDSWASVMDDGQGMSEQELVKAMRIGSRSPMENRDPSDLGRYGLGMKTASISHARSLTVASRNDPKQPIRARRWDLDHLAETGDWQLLRVSPEKVPEIASSGFDRLDRGTLVLWKCLDRLVGPSSVGDAQTMRQFHEALNDVESHVAMVFHRFMTGSRSVAIQINGQPITPWDPFLTDQSTTQRMPSESVGTSKGKVIVTPFVLPHHTHVPEALYRVAAGPAGWNAQQGFYVYRNRRLLMPGDWLGLGFVKDVHYKLARIQIDLLNSSDHDWDIDVRKSRARPPVTMKDDLRRIARAVRKRAVTVYRHRGKAVVRTSGKSHVFVWQRRVRGKIVEYRINRDHPILRDVAKTNNIDSKKLNQILRLVEEYIPVQQIWVDMADGDESQKQPFQSAAESEIIDLIKTMYIAFVNSGMAHRQALDQLGITESIGDRFELVEPTVKALLKEETVG